MPSTVSKINSVQITLARGPVLWNQKFRWYSNRQEVYSVPNKVHKQYRLHYRIMHQAIKLYTIRLQAWRGSICLWLNEGNFGLPYPAPGNYTIWCKKKSTLSCAGSGGVRVHATYAVDPCSNPSQRTLCCMSPPPVSHLFTVKNKGVYTWRNPYKQKRTSSTVDSFIWLLCSWITYPAQEKYCLLQGRRG